MIVIALVLVKDSVVGLGAAVLMLAAVAAAEPCGLLVAPPEDGAGPPHATTSGRIRLINRTIPLRR
jgi:hypothetical protein